MKIRKYEPDDWLWLADFNLWINGVGCKMKEPPDNVICFVAENEDGIVGFICGEITPLFGNLLIAAEVRPEHRHNGIFTSLLEEYKQHSETAITVFHNIELNDLYRKLVFTLGAHLGLKPNTFYRRVKEYESSSNG